MREIVKIAEEEGYWKPTIFRSASAAADDMGISKHRFLRRLNKDGQVKDGANTYVEPYKY